MDFWKAFNIVTHAQPMKQLETLVDVQWGMYVLYESVAGKPCSPDGFLKVTVNMVG